MRGGEEDCKGWGPVICASDDGSRKGREERAYQFPDVGRDCEKRSDFGVSGLSKVGRLELLSTEVLVLCHSLWFGYVLLIVTYKNNISCTVKLAKYKYKSYIHDCILHFYIDSLTQ